MRCNTVERKYHDRDYYDRNRDEICAKAREYSRTHKRPYKKRIRDKDKAIAYVYVWRALKSGKITKTPCQVCGGLKVESHHHKGYDGDNKIDVIWLCRDHHAILHRKERSKYHGRK